MIFEHKSVLEEDNIFPNKKFFDWLFQQPFFVEIRNDILNAYKCFRNFFKYFSEETEEFYILFKKYMYTGCNFEFE